MKTLLCISNDGLEQELTIGKKYLYKEYKDSFLIENDRGYEHVFVKESYNQLENYKKWFVLIEKHKTKEQVIESIKNVVNGLFPNAVFFDQFNWNDLTGKQLKISAIYLDEYEIITGMVEDEYLEYKIYLLSAEEVK